MMMTYALRASLAAFLLVLAGCGPTKKAAPDEGNRTAKSIDRAASLHTSITSVTPWNDIKDKLAPGFELKAPDALSKSIPTTLVRLDRVLDILRFQLALTAPITKESSTTTRTSETGKDDSTKSESKTEKSSPDLPGATPPTGLTATSPTFQTPPDTPADVLLQYQAAASLLRDVAVLNTEIENVSRRTGQEAFLTRIQVSVMPLSRGLGYDVYANLTMFTSDGSFDQKTGARTPGSMQPIAPLVIPILSTDSLQATRRVNSSTAKREIGLALNILKGIGAAGASLGNENENENEAAGADLESVVTVGRLSDNTIRIRMGADPMPGGGYGMVPRTFNISAVVFVPRKAKQLLYVSRLSMHHVKDGSELTAKRSPSYDEGLKAIVRGSRTNFPYMSEELLKNHLDDYAFHGDFGEFERHLRPYARPGITDLELRREIMYKWAELIALNRQSRYASSLVDLPWPSPLRWPARDQLVAYTSTDKGVTVSLGNGDNLRAQVVTATLAVKKCLPEPPAPKHKGAKKHLAENPANPDPPCKTSGDPSRSIQASDIQVAKDGRSLIVTFPPLDRTTSLKDQARFLPHSIKLSSTPNAVNVSRSREYTFEAVAEKKLDPDPDDSKVSAIKPDSRIIIADKSRKGRVSFYIQGGGKDGLRLEVSNATIVTINDEDGKQLARKQSSWEVKDGGRYSMSLENLSESAVVQLSLASQPATAKKATALATSELRVEQLK
ncbi:MAG: hypothetical protein QM766_21835 [Burkholderiaceae bacterium]